MNAYATDYTYDPFGNIRSHQGVSYAYDRLNRVTRITYPSGNQIGYAYDATGRVTQVEGLIQGAPLALASQIRTAPQGPLTALTYGNGLSLSQRLDEAYLITGYTLPSVRVWEASYDKDGNLEKRVDKLGAPESAYRYDALDRLDVATGPFGQRDYDYDPNGNRQRLLSEAGTQLSTYAPASNRLTSTGGTTVETDATGDTVTQGPWQFAYNSHNRLRTVHEGALLRAQYAYNGIGQRREKLAAGITTRYVYGEDGKLLAELDATGTVLKGSTSISKAHR